MPSGVLDMRAILDRVNASPPLVEGAPDLQAQVQSNGIDLTVRDVARYTTTGAVDFTNAGRVLAQTEPVEFDSAGRLRLLPGPYLVSFNEVVHLPLDLAALGRTRSSLLRCGVALHTAVWDAGYSGRSQSLMVVYNPEGFTLQQDARIMQLVFLLLERSVEEGYRGAYQSENT